jgi:hypothetical protein
MIVLPEHLQIGVKRPIIPGFRRWSFDECPLGTPGLASTLFPDDTGVRGGIPDRGGTGEP